MSGVPGAAIEAIAAAPGGASVIPLADMDRVTVSYRHRTVLREATLRIKPGERLALIGPNGAGKSTLLRALTGIIAPRSGSVSLGGDPVASLDRRAIARRVAVVPGSASVPFAARVEDVVALGRLPYLDPLRGPRAVDRAAVDTAIELVGIGHLRERDARELSLGERQLTMIALAVAQRTPFLVLDEPTVHLDLRHQVAVMDLLVRLNEGAGITVLAVLHDLALATHFFPRMVVLDRGGVVADDAPELILAGPVLRAAFGVDPAFLGAALRPSTPVEARRPA
jgi:iron complex transport system ATP-binding protein